MQSTISYEVSSALWVAIKDDVELVNSRSKLDRETLLERALLSLTDKYNALQSRFDDLDELDELQSKLDDSEAKNRELEHTISGYVDHVQSLKRQLREAIGNYEKASTENLELKIWVESLTGNE